MKLIRVHRFPSYPVVFLPAFDALRNRLQRRNQRAKPKAKGRNWPNESNFWRVQNVWPLDRKSCFDLQRIKKKTLRNSLNIRPFKNATLSVKMQHILNSLVNFQIKLKF